MRVRFSILQQITFAFMSCHSITFAFMSFHSVFSFLYLVSLLCYHYLFHIIILSYLFFSFLIFYFLLFGQFDVCLIFSLIAKGLVAELAPPHAQSVWGFRGEKVQAARLAACCNYF